MWERIGKNSRMDVPERKSWMLFTPVSNAERYLSLRSPPTSKPYVVVTRVAPTPLPEVQGQSGHETIRRVPSDLLAHVFGDLVRVGDE